MKDKNTDDKEAKAEESYYTAESLKVSAYLYGKHFKERADDLKKEVKNFRRILISLFIAIVGIFVYLFFNYESTNYNYESTNYVAFFLIKNSGLIFLVSVFWWVTKLYNQLRQLQIFYLDKYILAETYCKFIQNSDDASSHALVRKIGIERLFSSSLDVQTKPFFNNTRK